MRLCNSVGSGKVKKVHIAVNQNSASDPVMLTRTWGSRPRPRPRTWIPRSRPRPKDLSHKAKAKAKHVRLKAKAKAKDSKYQEIFHRSSCIVFLLLKCCGCFYVRILFFVLTAFCPFMNKWICYCC